MSRVVRLRRIPWPPTIKLASMKEKQKCSTVMEVMNLDASRFVQKLELPAISEHMTDLELRYKAQLLEARSL